MVDQDRGRIHVYTGEGKGKTTAALGLALRAAGHGWHTYVGQFMKGQTYGELEGARMLGCDAAGRPWLTIVQFGHPSFVRAGAVSPEDVRLAREGLARAAKAMCSGAYQIVVLDEINVALHFDLLTTADVLDLIGRKPDPVELILTGRRVPEAIIARADYVTDMREIRHPYNAGLQAREGIEF
jgi:cob(I)alamin adenosyltransferase